MRFLAFKQHFSGLNSITFQDIKNVFGLVNQSQMSAWKKSGYITSIKRGRYVLNDQKVDALLLANEINDSYISLEFALSYYQMIPEITPTITSVSNKRKEEMRNQFGNFSYTKISPKLFCGFVLVESRLQKGRFIRIAEREKALFDLVYLREDLVDVVDFASLRLNLEKIRKKRIRQFVDLVAAPQIRKRLNNFLTYLDALD